MLREGRLRVHARSQPLSRDFVFVQLPVPTPGGNTQDEARLALVNDALAERDRVEGLFGSVGGGAWAWQSAKRREETWRADDVGAFVVVQVRKRRWA